MSGSITSLFSPEPDSWGLRDDPYLWREMAQHLSATPWPSSSSAFAAVLDEAFAQLTGHSVSFVDHIYIARHAHGGMSSGHICTEFWRERGIPFLVCRFEAQQALEGLTASPTARPCP